MPRRRNSKRDLNSPEAVATRLPVQLRSFNAWYYDDNGKPTGLQDYLAALTAQVAPHEPMPVMSAAGLSAADWYHHMLTRPAELDRSGGLLHRLTGGTRGNTPNA